MRLNDEIRDVWEECLRLRDLFKFEFFFTSRREFDQEIRTETALLEHGAKIRLPAAVALQRNRDIERLLAKDPGSHHSFN